MTDKVRFPQLREQAIALRRAGKSRAEIKDILGIGSNETLGKALRGEPPPDLDVARRGPRTTCTRRRGSCARRAVPTTRSPPNSASPRARSRCGCVTCRARTAVPRRVPPAQRRRRRAPTSRRAGYDPRGARREAVEAAVGADRCAQRPRDPRSPVSIAYWCEGAKSKPYAPRDRVTFVNSDPRLILFFLRFLAVAGRRPPTGSICRVSHSRERRCGGGPAVLAGRHGPWPLSSSGGRP